MATLNECKYNALSTQTGLVDIKLNDMEREWLINNGATRQKKLNEQWREVLALQGYTAKKLNEALFEFLRDRGYTGSLNEMEHQFWCIGGGVIGFAFLDEDDTSYPISNIFCDESDAEYTLPNTFLDESDTEYSL